MSVTVLSLRYQSLHCIIHSFIPNIYIAPLQETYSEALSVQLWPKRNVLRSRRNTHCSGEASTT